jgi:phosphate transport system substrate-binding protein
MRPLVLALGCIAIVGSVSCSAIKTTAPDNGAAQSQVEVKIGGSSSSYTALESLGTAYRDQSQNFKMTMLPKGQSESAIAGVKAGLMNIAAISRTLKPEEKAADIQYTPMAQDGLLVATHKSVTGVRNLTTANLKAIYSGQVANWKALGGPDAEIVVLDRPEDESAKMLLRKHYLGKDLTNAPNAVVLKQEGELMTALENTPNAIGAFSYAQAMAKKMPVNHISLEGVAPTAENIAAGKYLMVRQLGLVTKTNPGPQTQSLLSFIQSTEGKKILQDQGFVTPSAQ